MKINGRQVLGQSDFKKRWGSLERTITLNPVNSIDMAVDTASKPGSRLSITLTGIDTTPEEVVVSEERGTIGSEGGILSLAEVGQIELAEDASRLSAAIALRKVKAPAEQEQFAQDAGEALSYADTVFDIESNVPINTPSAVRVQVPAAFAAALPAGQHVELYVRMTTDEYGTFKSLDATYDQTTGVVVATVPPDVWLARNTTSASTSFVTAALAANPTYTVQILLAGGSGATTAQASGQFTTLSNHELRTSGNERLQVGREWWPQVHRLPSGFRSTILFRRSREALPEQQLITASTTG